ncbi:MAG: outer rane biosis protein BamB, partial [Gemmataceae bacterium]|nr:outer rane biosis protein BamB [Gemmataceae bacterium]
MIRLSCAATLAVLVLGPAPARGQPGPVAEPAALRGESAQTRKRLSEAEQKLVGGKAADAVDDLQRILDEAGDDLVSVDGRHHRPARWVAHQILAKLPPDMLQTYRDRVDEPARKLLDAARRDRDPRPLWQLLDRYFVSRPGEEGLLLLGDLLFERGEFRTAELLWRRLLPDAAADVPYPAPKTDPAAVLARGVLAAIFQGEQDRAKAELGVLRAKHPTAAGVFAGKTGPYADTLQAFIDHPPPVVPDPVGGRAWPTFGGDPGRTGRVHGAIPVHWPTRPTWKAPIPQDKSDNRSPPARPPFGHPVIAGGRVYLSDGSRVTSFDLRTGGMGVVPVAPQAALADPDRRQNDPGRKASDPDPCSSLTAAGGRLFARLGQPVVRAPESSKVGKAAEESAIVCFAPPANPGRNAPPMRELWRVAPPAAEGKGPGVWEGTPLVAGGRMWVALARFEGGRVVHAVAGFDPADPDRAPDRPAWVVDVCDSPLPPAPDGQSRARQELLTLAGRNVVLCSNGGAVVAVDAATGRR